MKPNSWIKKLNGVGRYTIFLFAMIPFVKTVAQSCTINIYGLGTNPQNSICSGQTATLTTDAVSNFLWSNGATASFIIVNPTVTTVYTLVATSNLNCTGTSDFTLFVNNPSFTISTPAIVCSDEQFNYNINGAPNYTYSYSHIPASSPPMTSTSGTLTLTQTTLFQVTALDGNGCTSTNQTIIQVNSLPNMYIVHNPSLICAGKSSTLTVSATPAATAHLYVWTHGPTVHTTVVNPQFTTTYTVTGTNTVSGCSNTKTITMSVFEPTFSVNGGGTICPYTSATLTAVGATNHSWEPGGPQQSKTWVVSPTLSTIYTVTALSQTAGGLKCPGSTTVQVLLYDQPTVVISPERTLVCKGESIKLTANGAATYYWYTLHEHGSTVTVEPVGEKSYGVIGTDPNGCTDSASVLILFSQCVRVEEKSSPVNFSIYPNPGNEYFMIETRSDMELFVYDLQGHLVQSESLKHNKAAQLDLHGFPPGMYVLRAIKDGSAITRKIVVQ